MEEINLRDHFGLVGIVVKKFVKSGQLEETEEWADGMVGLARAKKEFKPELGNKFCTFAYWCILNEILKNKAYFKRHHVPAMSLDFEVAENMCQYDLTPDPQDDSGQDYIDNAELVSAIFERLNSRLAFVLRRRMMDGFLLKEVGAELGVGRERVRQMENEGLSKARKICEKLDLISC